MEEDTDLEEDMESAPNDPVDPNSEPEFNPDQGTRPKRIIKTPVRFL